MVWLQCTGLASVTTYILRVKNPRPLLRCGLLPNYLGQFFFADWLLHRQIQQDKLPHWNDATITTEGATQSPCPA